MRVEATVIGAGGVHVAQRGAAAPERKGALHVGPVAAIRQPNDAPIESQRGDHVVWRRLWAGSGRLVIDFVGLAVVQIDDSDGLVTFDRDLPADVEQHLLLDQVLPLVLARRGHLVLHGALISLAGRGVVLVGASGAGKSTLSAFAWTRGWSVGGDDGTVLSTTQPPRGEPTYATVRLTDEGAALLGFDQSGAPTVVGKTRFQGDSERGLLSDSVTVDLIAAVEPTTDGSAARMESIRGVAAHAMLFSAAFHADVTIAGNLPTVMAALVHVVEATRVGRLFVPRGIAGLSAAELVLRLELAR